MGRLPNTYADRVITDRDPYSLFGELLLTTAQVATDFPQATFSCQTDKPFEVHRMIPRLYALDSQGVMLPTQPDQELLAGLIKVSIKVFNREQAMTRVPTRIGTLTKGSSERTWEWADPEYLQCSTGFQVTVQADTFPAVTNMASILVAITFEGFLIVIAPATNNR